MATPPFNNTRLNPHEALDKKKQEELFDAITRNLEDLYNRFQTSEKATESLNSLIRSAVSGSGHKVSWGAGTITFSASKTSATTEVAHGLSAEPFTVLAIAKEAPGLVPSFSWSTPTKTKFSIKGELSGVATGSISFTWLAIV